MYRSIASGMILIILAGYFLFAMKREVEGLNFSFRSLSRQIQEEKSAINILKAEFSHLTSPSRIQLLADTHLHLANINSKRMVSDPLHEQENMGLMSGTYVKAKRTKQWRYKQRGDRNIHKASYKLR